MTRSKHWGMWLAVAGVLILASCADGSIDDPDNPASVLEVQSLTNPNVTSSIMSGNCQQDFSLTCTSNSGCVVDQVDFGPCIAECELTVSSWSGSVANVPKTSLGGTSPFNDVFLNSVTVQYDWFDTPCATPPRTIGLGGVTVPANGTASFTFEPISFQDLDLCIDGNTANLTLTFNAANGTTAVSDTVNRQLFVESCAIGP